MNIRFCYLYRDVGNYKQHNEVVFSNQENLKLAEIEQRIINSLIERERFSTNEWELKDLHYFYWDTELDHNWHEFNCVVETTEAPSSGDINEFLLKIERIKIIN